MSKKASESKWLEFAVYGGCTVLIVSCWIGFFWLNGRTVSEFILWALFLTLFFGGCFLLLVGLASSCNGEIGSCSYLAVILSVGIATLFLIRLGGDHPIYGEDGTRVIITAMAVYLVAFAIPLRIWFSVVIFSLLAVLFNPVYPLSLADGTTTEFAILGVIIGNIGGVTLLVAFKRRSRIS